MSDLLKAFGDIFIVGLGLHHSGMDSEYRGLWLYRLVIAVLLSILATLYTAEKFLPQPWLKDRGEITTRLKMLETRMADIKKIEQDIRALRKENIQLHLHQFEKLIP